MKLYQYLFFLLGFFVSCQKAPLKVFHTEDLFLDDKLSNDQTQYFRSSYNLSELNSKEYYQIKAQFFSTTSPLFEEDCHLFGIVCHQTTATLKDTSFGFLELVSHSKDSYLNDGITLKIERQKKDLIVKVKVKAWPYKNLLVKKDYFLNQSEIDWTVAVHNGLPQGFRVQIWDNLINIKSISKQRVESLTARNLIIDSQDLTFVEQAYGLKWGVTAYKTKVQIAKRIFKQ